MSERCVCCGAIIPEGQQTCPSCKKGKLMVNERLYAAREISTGKLVSDTTGLNVFRFLEGKGGGAEQIASRVAYDEVDLLLFFRDASQQKMSEAEETLLRLCDMHNVPVATNIATAEVLVCALGRGDLDWREIYRTDRKNDINLF